MGYKFKMGKTPDEVWSLFTNAENPKNLQKAVCKHCKKEVKYHKKSERVKEHLASCKPFIGLHPSEAEDDENYPTFLVEEKYKKRRLSFSTPSSQSGLKNRYFCPVLKMNELKLFHQQMALHYYLTGTSFSRIEQDDLLAALRILRPDVTLPSRKDLAGKLLDDCYKDLKSKVCLIN